MMVARVDTHIAYRCPECGTLIYGFVGKFALSANLLRIKCSCGHSALDVSITNDNKIRLSVPCLFCKQNHNYVLSQSIFFERDLFLLNCPYSNMDICFIGSKENVDKEAERAAEELQKLLASFEAESIKDIQPTESDDEDTFCDPAIYDTARFILKDLEADGKIDCPCHSGSYDVRFCDEGVEIYCTECEAKYIFNAKTAAASEEYLAVDSITLT